MPHHPDQQTRRHRQTQQSQLLDRPSEQTEGCTGVMHQLAIDQSGQQLNDASIRQLGCGQQFRCLINQDHQATDPQQRGSSQD